MPKLEERAAQAKADGSTVGRGRKHTGSFITGHCSTGTMVAEGLVNSTSEPREWHANCRGTVMNGNGTVLVCTCECHSNHTTCRDCGRVDVELCTDEGEKAFGCCVDREDCASELARRLRESPVHQFLTEQQKQAASKKAREVVRGGENAGVAPEGRGGSPRPTKARQRAGKTPQRCHCGCGTMTKGGQFAMGHDMKLKGRLFEAARKPYRTEPTVDNLTAATEIVARGWSTEGIGSGALESAVARVAETSADSVIKTCVSRRYETAEDGGA